MEQLDREIASLFHDSGSVEQYMQHLVGSSLVDALKMKSKKDVYVASFEKHIIPTDLLYQIGSHLFNDLGFSVNSPYHALSVAELSVFAQHAMQYAGYCRDTVVDIGCANGKKGGFLMKKVQRESNKFRNYLGFDTSVGAIKLAEDTVDAMKINDLDAQFVLGDAMQAISAVNTSKTLLFLGGTFSNLSVAEQKTFLQQCYDVMSSGDTLVLDAFVEEIVSYTPEDVDDLTLAELQKDFVAAEQQRYERYNLWAHEKEIDIAQYHKIGVEVRPEDFDIDMIRDQKSQCLIDKRTFHRDIYAHGEIVIAQGIHNSSGTILDKAFFITHPDVLYKQFIESCYISRDSNAFIYHILQRFGLTPDNSIIHYAYHDHSLHIDLEVSQDATLYIFDTAMSVRQGDVFTILDSQRQQDAALIKQFKNVGFTVAENFPILLNNTFFPKQKLTVMRSYILQK